MPNVPKAKAVSGSDRLTRLLFVVVALLLLGIAVLVLSIVLARLESLNAPTPDPVAPDEYDGTIEIDPPQQMPDFTLFNQQGETIRLSDLRGRHVLLTFGFTSCPDVCPMTLNEFRRIRASLANLSRRIAFVFVSVDGERDTPNVIREYFALRQLESIIGMTGDEASLRALGADYGLSFERTKGESKANYLVNHTAGSFLLDAQGRWVMRYQFGVLPSSIVEDLKARLRD